MSQFVLHRLQSETSRCKPIFRRPERHGYARFGPRRRRTLGFRPTFDHVRVRVGGSAKYHSIAFSKRFPTVPSLWRKQSGIVMLLVQDF